MPDFGVDDISIEPWEYISACSSSDIKELIKELMDDGHIKRDAVIENTGPSKPSLGDSMFEDNLNLLYSKRLNLTLEEEDYINNIAKRLR